MEFNRALDFKKGRYDVVTLGELVVDFISNTYLSGDEPRFMKEITGFSRHFGGSPGNIAVNLKALGFEPGIISAVGDDFLGDYLLEFLHQRGVSIQGISRLNKVNTSMVFVSKSISNPSFFAVRGSDKALMYTDHQENILDDGKILHFTSWSLSHEPARSTTRKLLKRAKEKGLMISFDPNFREVLWDDPIKGRRLITEVLPMVDFVKPSYDDACSLFGDSRNIGKSPGEYLQMFLDHGVKIAILTLGGDGLLAGNRNEVFAVPAYGKLVEDTTGAGDAFWSGFYASLLKRNSVEEALVHGSRISAYKLRYTGGIAPLRNFEDMMKKEEH